MKQNFHMDGYINKYNVLFWASEDSRLTVANPLHPERFTGWCALSNVLMFGPVFIDGAVTFDVYVSFLSDEFVPFLIRFSIPMNSVWFQ
jgi:hypothetical protein